MLCEGKIILICMIFAQKTRKEMKRYLTITVLLIFAVQAFPQKADIKWYTLQEAENLIKENPKPIFIDAYTDWCGWCKKMDQETFTNPVIAEMLNTEFYPVKFNAEGKESITFLGQTFINDGKAGNAHQLAVALLQGRLSYPTVVFMTQKDNKYQVSPVPGFRQAKEMEMLLSFFADRAYESQKWEDYQLSFKGKVVQ